MISFSTTPSHQCLILPICKKDYKPTEKKILNHLLASEKKIVKKVLSSPFLPSTGIMPVLTGEKTILLYFYSEKNDEYSFETLGKTLSKAVINHQHSAYSIVPGMLHNKKNLWEALLDGVFLGQYQFEAYKGKSLEEKESITISNIEIIGMEDPKRRHWNTALSFTKDLVNTPPSIATPEYIEQQTRKIFANIANVQIKTILQSELQTLGMNGLCAVGQCANSAPRLLIVEYKNDDQKPKILVGKGITYDTGGLSLKTGGSMRNMKRDMAGAATVLGTVLALAQAKEKTHCIAIAPLAENAIGANAYKPDDVIVMANQTTVEVTNTDAEGRLVLADALWYAQKHYSPEYIIDLATLTGACVYAVGEEISAGFSNDKKLMQSLVQAGEKTREPIWELPLHARYKKLITSKIADIVNASPELKAGTIQAALFLEHFIEKETKWAHLDIAFTAFNKKTELATGVHVRTLLELMQR